MARILVIHYEPPEAARVAERVRREGFEADAYPHVGISALFRRLRESPPDAVLIDLARMPSYGRIVGAELRKQKGTRAIPLVFLEGDPEKTAIVREWLPDATFTSIPKIKSGLEKAIRRPNLTPVEPQFKPKDAIRKLGIVADSRVAMLHAPSGFSLGELPDGARAQTKATGATIVLLFAKSAAALGRELPSFKPLVEAGVRLWILWPKKASAMAGELSQVRIVEMCRAVGISGYKTCAVDDTWSGMATGPRRVK